MSVSKGYVNKPIPPFTWLAKYFGFGVLPKEYNPKVHGPYDPAVFYGKKDVPLGEVRIGELPAWLARRSKNPADWGRATSRLYWRWLHRWVFPKYAGLTPIIQLYVGLSATFYCINAGRIREHKNAKYHW